MFRKSTLRIASIISIILSSAGMLISLYTILFGDRAELTTISYLSIATWFFFIWAGISGYLICTKYDIYEEEYEAIGIRIYLIIVAFILYWYVGLVVGLAISVVLFTAIWSKKRNYDEWDDKKLR